MLEILVPEETRNLCTNPSIEIDTLDWEAVGVGVTIARSLTHAHFGKASLKVVTPGTLAQEAGRYNHQDPVVAGPYTVSVYVRGNGQVFLRLRGNDNNLQWQTDHVLLTPHYWQRLSVTGIFPLAETALTLAVRTAYNQATTFYLDGAQLEAKGHVTTYCDGDRELELNSHDGVPYFEWTGQRHTTESFRSRTYRGGGVWKDISQGLDWNLFPTEAAGLGMPPMVIGMQVFAGQEKGLVQATKALPRAIGLAFHARRFPYREECDPQSLQAIRQARHALISVLKPDLMGGVQSAVLRYTEGKVPMQLDVNYEGGLEFAGDMRNPWINSFGLRLLAPDPYWRTDSQDQSQVSPSTVPATNHAYLIARLTGQWDGFGSLNFPVKVIKVHPNGDVYAGGSFTNIGTVACRRIARWDGVQWNTLAGAGNDIDDGEVLAIDFAPNGDVYIGGTFTTIDAVTYNRVARYTPSTDAFDTLNAAGTVGVGSDVRAIAVDKAGYVYLGGSFITAGGAAAYRIVRYNGPVADTFTAIGTSSGLNLDVEALEIDLDGSTLYCGGQFTDQQGIAGGTALLRISKYTAAAGFEAMGEYAMNGIVRALRMGLDGRLFLAGDFTETGKYLSPGVWQTVWSAVKVAVWNRQEFYPLGGNGDGLTGGTRVNCIEVDSAGLVYFGGDFTAASNDALAAYAAVWNGTRFTHLDLDIGAQVFTIAARFKRLFLGYNGPSVSSIADVQEVTNEGAAAAYPVLDILGPVVLRYLENQETARVIRLNLDVLDGERVLLDLRPGYLKAESEWRGNVMYGIQADSDFGDFSLLPGDNTIAFHGTGGMGATEVVLRWMLADWSFDEAR